MPQDKPASLKGAIAAAGKLSARVFGAENNASWGDLAGGRLSAEQRARLHGRSVLVATGDRFASAVALTQLDGLARRMVLCPVDVSRLQLGFLADAAAADAIVTDQPARKPIDSRLELISLGDPALPPAERNSAAELDQQPPIQTEWILLTSGTSGVPKLVRHTLATLSGAIEPSAADAAPIVWSTFYDILRYGGLQIFLRATLTGTPLVLPGTEEPTEDFLTRAGTEGITHISGTPSHWRRALMSSAAGRITPVYVRLSGEIADQAILNQLRSQYPEARIAHAFASTEAGVAFAVNDGLMGFPAETLGRTPNVEMKVKDGTLRVRSDRSSSGYLGGDSPPVRDADAFVDTGDALELRNGRYYFVGRRDGTINVGGLKVHPEEVEMIINRHPAVGMSLVRPKKNPITGTLVFADVVLNMPVPEGEAAQTLQRDILQFCRGELASHKVPVAINFVPSLAVAETGKLIRRHA